MGYFEQWLKHLETCPVCPPLDKEVDDIDEQLECDVGKNLRMKAGGLKLLETLELVEELGYR
jgi:hypothetical protein